MKPLIGLTSYREVARWGVWDQPADLLPVMYADAIVRAGGVPVLLPPATDDPDAAAAVVAPPRRAGGQRRRRRGPGDLRRGAPRADQRPGDPTGTRGSSRCSRRPPPQNLPTLGVCRGMQVMAVATGGTLEQHTPDEVGHEQHSPGGDAFGDIEVKVDEASALHTILGPAVTVRCHHHQSVRSHPGYVATARAADGSLEAMEAEGTRFCLGVQWHPEAGRDQRLFDALVKGRRRVDRWSTRVSEREPGDPSRARHHRWSRSERSERCETRDAEGDRNPAVVRTLQPQVVEQRAQRAIRRDQTPHAEKPTGTTEPD